MIHEVDDALRRLVKDEALRGTDIEVAFDAPTKDWSARRNAPTINLYLYDIREDMRRRSRGLVNEYRTDGTVAARHLPPRYVKLSYLLTAWTQRPEDEHRLLSALLACLLRHESVPPGLLAGSLVDLGLPVPMTVALPPPEDRAFADVWTALGGELKPSLDVVVSAPVDPGTAFEAGPPVTEGLVLRVEPDDLVAHRVFVEPDASAPPPRGRAARAAPRRPAPGDVLRIAMVRRRLLSTGDAASIGDTGDIGGAGNAGGARRSGRAARRPDSPGDPG
jgi:hypothetical protein